MSSQKFKETYRKFILSHRDSILKSCTTTLTMNNSGLFNSSTKSYKKINSDILEKWIPAVESIKLPLSLDFKETICIYLETITMCIDKIQRDDFLSYQQLDNSTMSDELKRIHRDIIARGRRSRVIDKHFNYNTGRFEFELEDGRFIPEDGIDPIINLDLSVFPEEFLPLIDESEFRNAKIDQII